MKPCVYILLLTNGEYYIGSTTSLPRRLKQHNKGKTSGIKFSKPVEVVLTQEYDTIKTAINIERKLKKFKSRKIIEKIIREGKIKVKV